MITAPLSILAALVALAAALGWRLGAHWARAIPMDRPVGSPWQRGAERVPEGVDLLVVWGIPGWGLHGPPGLARYDAQTGWWDCEAHDFAAAEPAWWIVVPPLPDDLPPGWLWRMPATPLPGQQP